MIQKAKEEREAEEAEKDRIDMEKADNAMFDEWEEQGKPLLGPLEEENEETGEVQVRHIEWSEKKLNQLRAFFFPKHAKASAEANYALQAKVDKRRKMLKERGEAQRKRDANGKHGPYCFCGCRAY